ncbi:ribonuclease E activity regulator RraA [Allomuricauda sp. d1]|uniref:ribonuclease E activity regulator RraA n=1 Tax=Allomuricauda sp. d1 TaxID=3136725 RepID=UPI0031D0D90F
MFSTADLSDFHAESINCANPIFKSFGTKNSFAGRIVTIKLFEDNSLLRKQLEEYGKGQVLVVDGGGSLRCALLGDQLAALAIKNHWNGIVINGCIRDSAQINAMPIGVRALNTSPIKSIKRNIGEVNVPVKFAGVIFVPHHYVYVDTDGILISDIDLLK